MDTGIDGSVDSKVKSGRLATSQAHVGGGSLEALLSLTSLGGLNIGGVLLSGVLNTLDDVGHGAGAVGAENLDGVDIGLLGHTKLLTSDSAGAVGAVTVAILVNIASGDGLAPVSTAFKVDVLGVGASVNDVDVDALTTVRRV